MPTPPPFVGWLERIVSVNFPSGGWVGISGLFHGSASGDLVVNGVTLQVDEAPNASFHNTPYNITQGDLNVSTWFGVYFTEPDVDPPHHPVTATAIFFRVKGPDPFIVNISASIGDFVSVFTEAFSSPRPKLQVGQRLTFAPISSNIPAFVIPPSVDFQSFGLSTPQTRSIDPKTLLIS